MLRFDVLDYKGADADFHYVLQHVAGVLSLNSRLRTARAVPRDAVLIKNSPIYPVPRTLDAFFTSCVLTHKMAPKRSWPAVVAVTAVRLILAEAS